MCGRSEVKDRKRKRMEKKINGRGTWQVWKRAVLDTVFPWSVCVLCGQTTTDDSCLCPHCLDKVLRTPRCRSCGAFLYLDPPRDHSRLCAFCRREPKQQIDHFWSALPYEGKGRELILDLKYQQKKNYARPLGSCLAFYLAQRHVAADFLVPVPLHDRRLAERGYNQAALLAEEVGAELNIPVLSEALVRHKETKLQFSLSLSERKRNLEGAFSPGSQGKLVSGKKILLVDDILTSGTTALNCVKVLKKLGAERVEVATVAVHAEKC